MASWKLLMASWRLLMASWKAAHGLVEATHGLVEATHGLVEATHGLVEATHGLVEATHGLVEGHSWPRGRLLMASWEATMASWRPLMASWRATHGLVEATHGLVEANHGLVEATHGFMKANHSLLWKPIMASWEANHGFMEANHGLAEANHGLVEANHGLVEANHSLAEPIIASRRPIMASRSPFTASRSPPTYQFWPLPFPPRGPQQLSTTACYRPKRSHLRRRMGSGGSRGLQNRCFGAEASRVGSIPTRLRQGAALDSLFNGQRRRVVDPMVAAHPRCRAGVASARSSGMALFLAGPTRGTGGTGNSSAAMARTTAVRLRALHTDAFSLLRRIGARTAARPIDAQSCESFFAVVDFDAEDENLYLFDGDGGLLCAGASANNQAIFLAGQHGSSGSCNRGGSSRASR